MLFTSVMTERGVEVLDMHDLLATTVSSLPARKWLLDRKLGPDFMDPEGAQVLRPWLEALPAAQLAERLIGGVARADVPFDLPGLVASCANPIDLLLPPLPNALFTRDHSCWIGDAVVLGSMFWPARRQETLLMTAIYRFHPAFNDTQTGPVPELWGDPDTDHGLVSLEGGDVMPIGDGMVPVGMGERTSPQALSQLAHKLFARGSATQVLAAQLPRSRGAMHLDTVFTFCNVDLVTVFPEMVNAIRVHSIRHGSAEGSLDIRLESKPFLEVVADALLLPKLRTVVTSGDAYESEREQWNDGNNLLALAPGVVMAYNHNTHTNTLLRKAGVEVITIPVASWGAGAVAATACRALWSVMLYEALAAVRFGFNRFCRGAAVRLQLARHLRYLRLVLQRWQLDRRSARQSERVAGSAGSGAIGLPVHCIDSTERR